MKRKSLAPVEKKKIAPSSGESQAVSMGKEFLSGLKTQFHPDRVAESIGQVLLEGNATPKNLRGPNDNITLGLALGEFDNGILLSHCVPNRYRTFAIDLMLKIIKEYRCRTASENATAELAVTNFVHILEVQERMTTCLSQESIDNLSLQYLAILGKERERANRDYLLALQQLRSLKQAPIQVKVNAQTAIVGNQQIVQANNNHGENN